MLEPRTPWHLTAKTRAAWHTFWRSSVAQYVEPCDLPALTRLFQSYDDREHLRAVLAADDRAPVHYAAAHLDQQIRVLEGRFYITPRERRSLPKSGRPPLPRFDLEDLDDLGMKETAND